MVEYKCFNSACNKKVSVDYLRKRIRCPYCGSKIIFKPRSVTTKVKAR
jgi:DNA-directed RNA polymerase subunit RPC12/RpoP